MRVRNFSVSNKKCYQLLVSSLLESHYARITFLISSFWAQAKDLRAELHQDTTYFQSEAGVFKINTHPFFKNMVNST